MALTSKELTAVEDQLTLEQSLVAKYKLYASTAIETEIRTKLDCLADKHQKHYDMLAAQLSS
ncbi:hypothetical protein FACS1894105_12600 [Clostridia bacterium]|nr:hypothetical protein FACS1894105_12600 [Clostridia bacterium]